MVVTAAEAFGILECPHLTWKLTQIVIMLEQILTGNPQQELAEYGALQLLMAHVLWIQSQKLDRVQFHEHKIYIDNESTRCMSRIPSILLKKQKHIAIRHHFIRDAYEKKLIQVLKIHTDDNVADLLTKAFDVSRF
ncbi:hypothetical protein Tco_1056818 [Tanacetum coccineum]|uniref:Copia protein n=1 Tax=Tanacetum coccineum TaxID=301880 RepID=A0ABQ5H3P2_9ASTR